MSSPLLDGLLADGVAVRGNRHAWLAQSRGRALAQLGRDGMPGSRNEAWKYSSLRALGQRPWTSCDAAAGEVEFDGGGIDLRALDEFQRRTRARDPDNYRRTDYDRQQLGFNVRGPLVRDKLFFSLNYELGNTNDNIEVVPGRPAFNPGIWDEFAGTFSALDGQPYQPRLDYRRKRGLVEEINRTIQDIEVDAAARASLRTPNHVKPGLVESHSSAQGAAPSAPR